MTGFNEHASRVAAGTLALGMALALIAPPASARDVMVGGEAGLDACAGSGFVTGLNPAGDNYLSVRAAPARDARELDRLGPRTQVWLCDEAGSWLGVVYGDEDCGVSSPIARRQPYGGPCRSGWVFERYIFLGAG